MNINLNFSDIQEMILEKSFPENYAFHGAPVTEMLTPLDFFWGNGYYRELFFEGIHIAYGNLKLRNKTSIKFDTDFETVEMHFDLSGLSTTQLSGQSLWDFKENQHNIIYVPGVKGKFDINSMGTEVMEINMHPDIFKNYLAGSNLFQEFINNINNQTPCLLGKHHMPITPYMKDVIRSIINCSKQGVYKKLFLESKVIELMLLQLEQFAHHNYAAISSLKPAEIEKMHLAKEIIYKENSKVYSLRQLALEIGTNEFTLKKGFKEVFGNTVFGMIGDRRMEQAKQKLLTGKESIAQISEHAGYKHPTHFIAAFKKKYGATPGKYK